MKFNDFSLAKQALTEFSKQGLRTLVLAEKELDMQEFES